MYTTVQMLRSRSILSLAAALVTITASMSGLTLTSQAQAASLPVLQDLLDEEPPLPLRNGGSRVSPFS